MTEGERIKLKRKEAGLTQKQLGERIGVSGAMIAQYENGLRRPKIETLRRIANALEIPERDVSTFVFKAQYIGSDGTVYPESTSWDDLMNNALDDLVKYVPEEHIKTEIDACFNKLDIIGKRELLKAAVRLSDIHKKKEDQHAAQKHT